MRQWAQVSRGSVNLVSALVKGKGDSPAHEGIRRVGAPSTQRPCGSGQANIRAHPPVEPARDHQTHHHHIGNLQATQAVPLRWTLTREAWRGRGPEGPRGGGTYTPVSYTHLTL